MLQFNLSSILISKGIQTNEKIFFTPRKNKNDIPKEQEERITYR